MADVAELVSQAFLRAEATHDRSQQRLPGPSDVGSCPRRVALMVADAPTTDPEDLTEKRAAFVGTWVHAGLLPQMRRVVGGRARYEVPVTVTDTDPPLRGSVDLWLPKDRLLVDLKTKGTSALSRVRTSGPSLRESYQVHLYAYGLQRAGHQVEQVALVYMGRERGDVHVHQQPVDPDVTADALAWWDAAVASAGMDPWSAPRGSDRRGPGLDYVCDECPWRTGCWPGVTKPQAGAVLDGSVSVEAACALLDDATARKSQAEKDQSWARALLADTEPQQYGPWRLTRSRGSVSQVVDREATEQLLALHDLELPTKPQTRAGSVTVKRVVT